MIFETKCKLIGTKTGNDSKGKCWYLLQFIDNEDKHLNIFGTKKDFELLKVGEFYNVSFSLYFDLKSKIYRLNGKVVS